MAEPTELRGCETLKDRAKDKGFTLCKGIESRRGGTGGGLSLSTLGGGVGGGSGRAMVFPRRGGKGGGMCRISGSSIMLDTAEKCARLA